MMLQKVAHRLPRSGHVSLVNTFERVLQIRVGQGAFHASTDYESMSLRGFRSRLSEHTCNNRVTNDHTAPQGARKPVLPTYNYTVTLVSA